MDVPAGKYQSYTVEGPRTFPLSPITFGFGAGSIAVKNASASTLYLDEAQNRISGATHIVPPLTHDHVRNWSAGQMYVNGSRALVAGEYVTFQVGSAVEPMPAAALIPNVVVPSDGMPNPAAQAVVAYNAVFDPVTQLWVRWRQADPLGGNILTGVAAVGSYHFDSAFSTWVPNIGARTFEVDAGRPMAVAGYADTADPDNLTAARRVAIGSSLQLARHDSDRGQVVVEPGHWRIGGGVSAGAASSYETGVDFSNRLYVARALHAACLQTSAGAAASTTVVVRDGPAGSGTIIFQAPLLQTGVLNGVDRFTVAPLGLTGSQGSRMSIEAAALPNGQVYLHLEGYSARQ